MSGVGSALGAVVGTIIAPGVGTTIGAALGGAADSVASKGKGDPQYAGFLFPGYGGMDIMRICFCRKFPSRF